METIPFLTKFKTKRISDPLIESVELKYDEKLEHNLFISKSSEFLLAMTRTADHPEEPDADEDMEYAIYMNNYYYGTKSFTNVRVEKPDEIDEQFLSELTGTATITRVMSESSDEDRPND